VPNSSVYTATIGAPVRASDEKLTRTGVVFLCIPIHEHGVLSYRVPFTDSRRLGLPFQDIRYAKDIRADRQAGTLPPVGMKLPSVTNRFSLS